jgi:hypothetical protein
MSLEGAILDTVHEVGRAAANAIFPDEIEYYAITLELVNSKGDTEDFITFPVNPSAVNYDDRTLVSIKKTMGGVTALDSSTFVPKNISLNGTFGRSFKLLLAPTLDKASVLGVRGIKGLEIQSSIINTKLKTGYGALKVLEKILLKSSTLDIYDKPYQLFLYMPMSGHNFLVKKESFKISQDEQTSNMMWKYNLSLTALAPLSSGRINGFDPLSVIKSTGFGLLQKGANALANNISKSINLPKLPF